MKSPFKFLDSYTKDDREIFFGRDREIEELYQKVFDSKILLVYGVSGTGKSSLIHCGLANKFNDTDWLPLVVRRGSNIIDSTASAIKSASVTPQEGQFTTPAQFKKGVRSLYLDHYKPVFFIFDQFEELFIFGDKEERKSFVQIVKSLIDSDLQCRLIFVMREEYMAGITEFERYIPTFFANRVRIEKMSHINALDAITKPCKVYNIILEEGFAEALLEKLSPDQSDVELTYLQVFLDKIFVYSANDIRFENDKNQLTFTLSLLNRTGNISDLLGSFLEEQISLLDNPDTALILLKSFVSVKGTKQPMLQEEAREYVLTLGKDITDLEIKEMIRTLVNLRILCDKDQNGKYELRHDALAIKIFEKITLVEKEVLEVKNFIDNAFGNWQKRGVLLSSDDLYYIAPYESRLYLSDELTGLIESSKAELIKAKRRKKTVLAISGIALLIVFACFTVWALIERNKSKEQELIAKANYFTSLSKEYSDSDPTKAFRLAEYAYSLNSSKEIRRNLVEIYSNNEFYNQVSNERTIKCNSGMSFQLISKTGRIVVNDQWKLTVHNSDGTIRNSQFIDYTRFSFAFAPDENSYLLYTYDDTARMFDISGKQILKTYIYPDPEAITMTKGINYFPDSKKFYTYNYSNKIDIWSSEGNLIASSDKFCKEQIILTPKSDRELFICSKEGTFYSWDLVNNKISITKIDLKSGLTVTCPVLLEDQRIGLYRSDKKLCIYDWTGNLLTSWEIDYVPKKMIAVDDKDMLVTINNKQIITWNYSGIKLKTLKNYFEISDVQYDRFNNRILFSNQAEVLTYQLNDEGYETVFKTQNRVDIDGNKGYIFEFGTKECKIFNYEGVLQKTIKLTDNYTLGGVSNTGRYIFTSNYSSPFLTVIDIQNNNSFNFESLSAQPMNISFSEDDKFILTSGNLTTDSSGTSVNTYSDDLFDLWTIAGRRIRSFKANSYISSLAITNDNSLILVGAGQDGEIWDTSGVKKITLSGHTDYVTSVDISEDGKLFLTGSWDATTRLWSSEGKTISIIKESITTPYDRKIVSFTKGNPYFITFNQYSSTAIEIYHIDGEIMQAIPGNVSGNCYYFKDKNSIIYYDNIKETVVSIKLKEPVEDFIINNNHNRLLDFEKFDYGITVPEDLLRSGTSLELYEAGRYLSQYKILDIIDPNKRLFTLNQAEKFFRKGLLTDTFPGKYYRRLTDIYIQKSDLSDKDIRADLDEFFTRMTATNDGQELFQAAYYYAGTTSEKTLKYGIHLKAIDASKKLLGASPAFNKTLGQLCSQLTFRLIEWKEYASALEAALISFTADPSNPYIITNLPLAYIFNNQYANAEKIYSEWKDKPWKINNSRQLYRDIFITDIIDLENKGISHPDFEKVKRLLEN